MTVGNQSSGFAPEISLPSYPLDPAVTSTAPGAVLLRRDPLEIPSGVGLIWSEGDGAAQQTFRPDPSYHHRHVGIHGRAQNHAAGALEALR